MIDVLTAQPSDLNAIVDMEQAYFSDAMRLNVLKDSLGNDLFLVLRHSNEVIGYILCQCILDEMEILRIAVHPEYRQKGYGRMLFDAARKVACTQGVNQCFLEVRESNSSAISLYKSVGFEQYGRRSRFYRQPDEDALLMKVQWGTNNENLSH